MESVKILLTNGTPGSGKSTLSLALALFLSKGIERKRPDELFPIPTLFDCSSNTHIYNKRVTELENNSNIVPPFEILPLDITKESLFNNSIDLILKRDAAYIFNLPDSISQSKLFQLILISDFIICPFILTDTGIYETAQFILFVKKAVQIYKDKGYQIDPKIFLIPNMVPASGIDPHIAETWDVKTKIFLPFCRITSNIQWRDNLLNEMKTTEWTNECNALFKEPLTKIASSINDKYRERRGGK